jgi:hypothetical protein
MTRRRRTIEADTVLLPHLIADGVVQEVALALHAVRDGLEGPVLAFLEDAAAQRSFSNALSDRADETYRKDARLARDVNSDACRELLARWMRPWAAERVGADFGPAALAALPEGFAEGEEPTTGPAARM